MKRFRVTEPVQHQVEIKKSRFLVSVQPVLNIDDAIAWLNANKAADANHNCWAYRIGQSYRFTDDGEPSGSAGKPVLAAIDGLKLDLVLVLVIRYFGGVKLGVGGLMRAYGGSASQALNMASLQEIKKLTRLDFHVPFDCAHYVNALVKPKQMTKLAETYDETGIAFSIEMEADLEPAFEQQLVDISRGQVFFSSINDVKEYS